LAFAFAVGGALAQAQPAPDRDVIERERAERQRQLEALTEELRLGADQVRRLEAEIDTARRDRDEIARRLVGAARIVQRAEAELTQGEARGRELAREEARLRDSLAERRDAVSQVLAALQRLGRNPPPALVVEPEGALRAVRSAILMGAILPELRAEAERVAGDLDRLAAVQREAAEAVETRRAQVRALAENRARLELLAEEKLRVERASAEEAQRMRARAAQIGREARSLSELVRRMDGEIAAARTAAEQAARAEAQRREAAQAAERRAEEERRTAAQRDQATPAPPPAEPERQVAALPEAARARPSLAFERTRGLLPLPAAGQIVRAFGADDGLGGSHRGVSVGTRADATVTSPSDGWVVYAGPFRGYGQLVIVNVGDGYHVLLAGMERITVATGQFVLAGEPVARMGQRSSSPATSIEIGSDRPVLYVEFRKDGQTIDPGPWWAETAERARG
jgi:septal ring factor EnvC (AmiA/AmiB activator)